MPSVAASFWRGFLKGMHRSLACERLFVAVPDRFTVLASNSVDLAHYSASTYKEAAKTNAAPLCPHVFIVEKGIIMGIVEVEGTAMIPSLESGFKHIPDECVVALAAVGVCMGQVNGKISRKANQMMLDIIAEKASEEPGALAQGVAMAFLQDVEKIVNLGAVESEVMRILKLSLARMTCKSLNKPEDEASYREFLLDVAHGMSGLEGGFSAAKENQPKRRPASSNFWRKRSVSHASVEGLVWISSPRPEIRYFLPKPQFFRFHPKTARYTLTGKCAHLTWIATSRTLPINCFYPIRMLAESTILMAVIFHPSE